MSRRSRSLSFASLLALAVLLLASTAASAAPKKQPPPEESFSDTVEVNVVNVEVFVTDAKGDFVPGLTRGDFQILEDGKPVEIANFYAAEVPAQAPEPQTAVAAPRTSTPGNRVPEEQRLYLVLFLDNRSLTPVARNKLLPSIEGFVRNQLRRGDRVLVVSYDGPGSVNVRQSATGDPAAVLAALEQAARESAGGSQRLTELRQAIRIIDDINPAIAGDISEAEMTIELYESARQQETRGALRALDEVLSSLSGLPGRKALVYASGGLSLNPGQGLWQALAGQAIPPDVTEDDASILLKRIGDRANASRITFYILGVPDAESPLSAARGESTWTPEQEAVERLNREQSLRIMAHATGGLAVMDPSQAVTLLDGMRRDLDHYYSLGYAPADRKQAGNHRIEVKVSRPGLQVRHRGSYQDSTRQERLGQQALAALILGKRAGNPLDVRVNFAGEKKKRKNQLEVTLTIAVPVSKLVLLPQDKVHQGKLTLLVGTRDEQGRTSDLTRIALPIQVPEGKMEAMLKQSVGYRTKLLLRPGPHRVVIAVRDEVGNVDSMLVSPYPDPRIAAKAGKSGR
jgi:VWFA-related protein